MCVFSIANCNIYNASTNYSTCIQCDTGSSLTISGQCATLPARCLSLDVNGYCYNCSTGYQPIIQNNQSICIFRVANCSLYDINGRCTQCQTNYVLQSNTCNFFIANCATVNNSTKLCLQCINGYTLTADGYCINIPFCNQSIVGNCISCILGYQLINGICYKNNIPNCDI